ncbi:MAG: hypothetical protein AAGG68_19775 [Bacteroidota bacterium]
MNSRLIFIAILLFYFGQIFSQVASSSSKGIAISHTINQENFKDERLSFRNRTSTGFTSQLSFFWDKKNTRQTINLGFGKNTRSNDTGMVSFENLRPRLTYAYQRILHNFHVGGTLNVESLLSFPVSGRWAGNNSISYTIWSSIGLSTAFHQPLFFKKQKFALISEFHLPVLSYVVRPSYGLPYPEDFLKDETFDFQRKNMTASLLTSGKIRSLNQFQQLNFRVGFSSFLSSKQHEIRLSYSFDYLKLRDVKSVRQMKNGLQLLGIFKF